MGNTPAEIPNESYDEEAVTRFQWPDSGFTGVQARKTVLVQSCQRTRKMRCPDCLPVRGSI
jgi:hypothetical protein